MRADVESTRHHGGQLDRSTCGRPNFCIRTLIEAIFGLLERSRSVEWQTKYWSISDQTFSAVCLILSCSASMSPLILGGLDGMKMLLGLLEPILKLAGSLCSYRGCYWILRRMRSLPIQALLGGKKPDRIVIRKQARTNDSIWVYFAFCQEISREVGTVKFGRAIVNTLEIICPCEVLVPIVF